MAGVVEGRGEGDLPTVDGSEIPNSQPPGMVQKPSKMMVDKLPTTSTG